MAEYVFDVKLWAVVHVTANNEQSARVKLSKVVDCVDVGFDKGGVRLTEASAEGDYDLIEIDGRGAYE